MEVVIGNMFESDCDVLVHQTNCIGAMGSGVAKEVRERYPTVYEEYKKLCRKNSDNPKQLLGTAQIVQIENKYLVNLFGQCNINNTWYCGGRVTDYEALKKGFCSIKEFMLANNLKTLALPYKLGCVRGGGKWEEVVSIIESCFGSEFEIKAYKLS